MACKTRFHYEYMTVGKKILKQYRVRKSHCEFCTIFFVMCGSESLKRDPQTVKTN